MRPFQPHPVVRLTAVIVLVVAAFLLGRWRAARAPAPGQQPAEVAPFYPARRSPQTGPAARGERSPAAPTPLGAADTRPGDPVVLDATRPVHIFWPLDIGPDLSPDRPDDRICLRARQGINELQREGGGKAYYAFRVQTPGRYQSQCFVRWTDDRIGSIDCNNSWFLGIDDGPAVAVGNQNELTHWQWVAGPAVALSRGVHWLRVELREDGPLMAKIALVPLTVPHARRGLDEVAAAAPAGFAGLAHPLTPRRPVREAEFYALPTRSLVIGKGHVNEITVGASWQQTGGGSFQGTIEITSPTVPRLQVVGDPSLACGPDRLYVRNVLELKFPSGVERRAHDVTVRIRDRTGRVVFREARRFVRPYVWAFLGPFQDRSAGPKSMRRGTGSLARVAQPCDRFPRLLANRLSAERLGLSKVPLVQGPFHHNWNVIADGSCCDWTGAVDLIQLYGHTGPAFAYAVTWIRAERHLSHRSFSFQADDASWLWINDNFWVTLPMDLPREANRLWTSGALDAGLNPVVVKITQNERFWGYRLDVVDWHWQGRRGDTLTGSDPDQWPTSTGPAR